MAQSRDRRWRTVAGKVPGLDAGIRALRRTSEVESLQRQLAATRPQPVSATQARTAGSEPFVTWSPPGHFYSPVPDMDEILRQADRIFERPDRLDGVDLNEAGQLELLTTLVELCRDVEFPAQPHAGSRYFSNNPSYAGGDAYMLQALMRHLKPKRYFEVGSGWTTALAVDTAEKWLDAATTITCVEPYPEAVKALLRPDDRVELIDAPVQGVPLDRIRELEPNDILFIDCSHVVKTGSDAHFLISRVLPVVPPGVWVHIHDIFWPFEYPRPWVEQGRAWSEAYMLHAFLMFNPAFEIELFLDWIGQKHPAALQGELPIGEAVGGAIWLRRVG